MCDVELKKNMEQGKHQDSWPQLQKVKKQIKRIAGVRTTFHNEVWTGENFALERTNVHNRLITHAHRAIAHAHAWIHNHKHV